MFGVKNSQHHKFELSSMRNESIKDVLDAGFVFEDNEQKDSYDETGFVRGKDFTLKKDIGSSTIKIWFSLGHDLRYSLELESESKCSEVLQTIKEFDGDAEIDLVDKKVIVLKNDKYDVDDIGANVCQIVKDYENEIIQRNV